MKLALVVPVLNQFELARTAIDFAIHTLSDKNDVEILILDNGSGDNFGKFYGDRVEGRTVESPMIKFVRLEKNIGVYPTFWEALKYTDADILAFIHSDLIIEEKGWDDRVLETFGRNLNMGLLGFIGSNEIDWHGGRGLGTTSNFQGLETETHTKTGEVKKWRGSHAGVHGKINDGHSKAAVVDGCTMIFRRNVLEAIKQRADFPPHHFYDRLLSCEVRELGYEVGVLGIGCDHISGQTVNQENAYGRMANEWIKNNLNMITDSPDSVIYLTAERIWLEEYRDKKHFIPCKV